MTRHDDPSGRLGVLRWAQPDEAHAEPAPFVILVTTPVGPLTVPAPSAHAAQTVARYLAQHCQPITASWQAGPHRAPGPVTVFGCARHPADGHLLAQDVHAFPLTPGQPTPPVWVALCGRPVEDTLFEALDHGMGRPCRGCHQRWTAHHHQQTDPVVSGTAPGQSVTMCRCMTWPGPVLVPSSPLLPRGSIP